MYSLVRPEMYVETSIEKLEFLLLGKLVYTRTGY